MTSDNISPVSVSIKKVEDFLNWSSKNIFEQKSFYTLSTTTENISPFNLACHDMMNGYQDDRYDQGVKNLTAFNFLLWQNVKIFVYFSHDLISIPPFVWRVAAHRNQCRILATFIVENRSSDLTDLLKKTSIDQTIDKLVTLCEIYQFDGYLINFEVSVDTAYVQNILYFLKNLGKKLKKLNPNNVVVWYDSIVSSGVVWYQDRVNKENIEFLKAVDYFFTNYNWKFPYIEEMKKFLGQDFKKVCVGLDIFKRNIPETYEKYEESVVEKYKYLQENKCSKALFAFGYLYEIFGSDDQVENYKKFWESLGPHDFRPIKSTYFRSSFCIGSGEKFFFLGKPQFGQFSNLSLQQIQPFYEPKRDQRGYGFIYYDSSYTYKMAYNGGSCYHISFKMCQQRNYFDLSLTRLFQVDLDLPFVHAIQLVYNTETALPVFGLYLDYGKDKKIVLNRVDKEVQNFIKYRKSSIEILELNDDDKNNKYFTGGLLSDSSWKRLHCVLSNFTGNSPNLKSISLICLPLSQESETKNNIMNLYIGEISVHSIEDFDVKFENFKVKKFMITKLVVKYTEKFEIYAEIQWQLDIPALLWNSMDCYDVFIVNKNCCACYVGRCMNVGNFVFNYSFDEKPAMPISICLQYVLKSGVRSSIENSFHYPLSLE